MIIDKIFCAIFAMACLQGAMSKPSEAQTKIVVTMHRDQSCFADAYGVWRHTPGSWAGWTRQMEGHVGEKCYYPTHRPERKVMRFGSKILPSHDIRPRSTVVSAGAASDAKIRLFLEFERWKQKRQKEQELDKLF